MVRYERSPKKQIEFKVIFSPAVGGRRKEVTTSNIVSRQGRIIAALKKYHDDNDDNDDDVGFTCTKEIFCLYGK